MFSYKTSLSSSSSPFSQQRSKSGPNSNKNKLLKDENDGLGFNNNRNDMQLISHSSYWPANENVKRSQQVFENGGNINMFGNEVGGGSSSDETEYNLKDFSLGAMPYSLSSSYDNSNTNINDDEVMYDEDYGVNGMFSNVNQDNINDFHFYINHLLSKKPNQKTI